MTPGILTAVGTELATSFGDVHFADTRHRLFGEDIWRVQCDWVTGEALKW